MVWDAYISAAITTPSADIVIEVDPAEACGPADDGRSGHGAKTGDDADEDGEEQKGHGDL